MNGRNRMRRATLVLPLVVLAAIVTGVAESAPKTAIPNQLTGSWSGGPGGGDMGVSPWGKVEIHEIATVRARFSHVTKHRLNISGGSVQRVPLPASCSGTGTYRWTILNHGDVIGEPGHELKLKKIHDACKQRVGEFTGIWFKT